MRVLVTGAAGCLGSHLCERLVADGHRVTAVDDLSTGRLASLSTARARKGLYVHRFDVTDAELPELLVREAPEVVVHLAKARSADSRREATVNVGGTVSLLSGCAAAGVGRVLLATDATSVYAAAGGPVSERAGRAPATAFGASQLAAEAYLEAMARRHGLRGVALRLACVYGPRRRTGVVARFAAALTSGRTATVFGDGSVARDLLYVEDAVDAVLRCLGGRADGRRLNIGSGTATPVRALHSLVAAAASVPDAPAFGPARPHEVPTLALDSGAARRALGWESSTTLEDGLALTVEWHQAAGRR